MPGLSPASSAFATSLARSFAVEHPLSGKTAPDKSVGLKTAREASQKAIRFRVTYLVNLPPEA